MMQKTIAGPQWWKPHSCTCRNVSVDLIVFMPLDTETGIYGYAVIQMLIHNDTIWYKIYIMCVIVSTE